MSCGDIITDSGDIITDSDGDDSGLWCYLQKQLQSKVSHMKLLQMSMELVISVVCYIPVIM